VDLIKLVQICFLSNQSSFSLYASQRRLWADHEAEAMVQSWLPFTEENITQWIKNLRSDSQNKQIFPRDRNIFKLADSEEE